MIIISNKKEKRSKFNVSETDKGKEKRTYNGIVYSSELECRFFREVVEVGLKSGAIKSYASQVKYEIHPEFTHKGKKYRAIHYVSDFNTIDKDGIETVIDVKGFNKPMDKIKHKLLLNKYPDMNFLLLGFSGLDGGWVPIDVIDKGRKERKKIKQTKEKSNV